MSKNSRKLKIPKRILGVKVPKETRRTLKALLGSVPAAKAKPMLAATIGTLVTSLLAKLAEQIKAYADTDAAHAAGRGKPEGAGRPESPVHLKH